MKYHIRIYYKGGFSYLWHRDKNAWCKRTAVKYLLLNPRLECDSPCLHCMKTW